MRLGIGGLGWRPADFWGVTITEFFEAIRGRNEANGGKQNAETPTDREIEDLLKRYG
ncbi:phage tail assembly chaperone [Rhizobium sp. BK491]|uniref:phage tail assembly chaperone n=1 Tax=Rhizobium sp. BK491 TaxID=2587009 RepID=UPI00161F7C88|nr:phage tail assembly chaperone [Rhizobium sp. BK491]MBB3567221.1 hypothetical protein [Rhizobium sp. BK491]